MKKRFLDDILLLENEDILVINKSSGISTLDDRKDTTNVLSEVKELYPQIKNCHRLDKYTSGALIFAKNLETYRSISLQFQNREVKKVYHALVHDTLTLKILKSIFLWSSKDLAMYITTRKREKHQLQSSKL
jgi:23S rRNA pseudouridine955/2504/2580 synthase